MEALEQKIRAEAEKRAGSAKANLAKYPHADPTTFQWDSNHNKYSVEIICAKCGARRRTFTSDLFQINLCDPCREKARSERKAMVKKAVQQILAGK